MENEDINGTKQELQSGPPQEDSLGVWALKTAIFSGAVLAAVYLIAHFGARLVS